MEAIEKIIERDYFPDISKLRDRLDWLEAIKTGDPMQIRDAQLKIMERRGKKVISGLSTDPRTRSRTPGSTFMRNFTPFDELVGKTPATPTPGGSSGKLGDGRDGGDVEVDTSLSLDEFFRRYTSEDNDSFSKILEKVNRKKKEKYAHLLEGEKEEDAKSIEDAKRDRITDGYGTSDQPTSTLDGCKHTAKNLLMYHPADRGEAPLTEEERAVRLKGLTKEINLTNTRFHGKVMDTRPNDDGTVEVLYTPVVGATPVIVSGREDKTKKYDLEDLRKTPNQFYVESGKKAVNGFSFVKTPSPVPGVDESLTWGEIEGRPLRLDPEDTPIDIGGNGNGPQFNIPSAPVRDVKAHTLSREAARKLRERSKMHQKPPLPSPYRGGSASPSVRTLSPAAQKFVRNAIAKSSSSVDETLRASYRGASPGRHTPKIARSTSRFGRDDGSIGSKSPSLREKSNSPW